MNALPAANAITPPTPPAGFAVIGYDVEPDAGEGFDLIAYAVRGDEWRTTVWGPDGWGPWLGEVG